MSLFTLISDGIPVSCGTFDEVAKMAAAERLSGHQVHVHRTTPAEQTLLSQPTWAVRVSVAGTHDVLHCLDRDDAVTTLKAVHAEGVRASLVRV